MNWIDKIISADNLYWAWSKTQRMSTYGDSWVDFRELSRFEGNLNYELETIANEIREKRYRIAPLRPILYPKNQSNSKEKELRQWFSISVKDQVTWIAFVNIVGPFLDYEIPPWCYSYRLYRPAWYEIDDNGKKSALNVGWYRNTSGHLYRRFQQSWPLYRRQIYLTTRTMTKKKYRKYIELNEADQRILQREEQLTDERMKLQYLANAYWKSKVDKIFWVGIDLKKFYPNISLESIYENLKQFLSDKWTQDIADLTKALLTFPLDFSGFEERELNFIFTEKERKSLNYQSNENVFQGLPTGLFVSGFLSNVAMLPIDIEVNGISQQYQIAHFRYVDDHTILAPTFDKLVKWIEFYKTLLNKYQPNVEINENKFEPKEVGQYLLRSADLTETEIENLKNKAAESSNLDPRFPTPLMTKTLALVSAINDVEFELLDEKEQEQLLESLEHLLLVKIPDQELRVDTRISFAASKIARLAPIRFPHYSATELYELSHKIQQLEQDKKEHQKRRANLRKSSKDFATVSKLIVTLDSELAKLKNKAKVLREQNKNEEKKEQRRTFSLLLKTLEDYPEKLRIWTRIIEFCRYTGFSDLDPIFNKLEQLENEGEDEFSYYRSFILEALTKQIYSCLKNIIDDSILTQHKVASVQFLDSLLSSKKLQSFYSKKDKKYYECASRQVFECAIGTTSLVLKHANRNTYFIFEDSAKNIISATSKYSFLDFKSCSKWGKLSTKYDLSVWAWYADQSISRPTQVVPSVVWAKIAPKLKLNFILSWAMLKKYPQNLWRMGHLFSCLSGENNTFIEVDDEGLLYEYYRGLDSDKKIVLQKCKSSIFTKFPNIIKAKADKYIDLYDWVDFLIKQKQENKNLFDPRLSEWTAIKIAAKICGIYTKNISHMSKRFAINPGNYLLPISWISNDDNEIMSWDKWSKKMDEKLILVETPIIDSRYTPIFLNKDEDDKQFAPIRGIGLLLLGLVLHQYILPEAWNPKGHSRAWSYIVKKLLHDAACSSWTGLILEACLLPRSRENLKIESLQKEIFGTILPDDMSGDPPQIASIDDLEGQLTDIFKKLKDYQISVQNNLPRQLTPVSVGQLTRNAWPTDNEED